MEEIEVFKNTVSTTKKDSLIIKDDTDKIKDLYGINGYVVNVPNGSKLKEEIELDYMKMTLLSLLVMN